MNRPDLANHSIKTHKLGVPTTSAEGFDLPRRGVISPALERSLRGMVGFRNVAVHQYQRLDLAIMETIPTAGLDDLLSFSDAVLAYLRSNP